MATKRAKPKKVLIVRPRGITRPGKFVAPTIHSENLTPCRDRTHVHVDVLRSTQSHNRTATLQLTWFQLHLGMLSVTMLEVAMAPPRWMLQFFFSTYLHCSYTVSAEELYRCPWHLCHHRLKGPRAPFGPVRGLHCSEERMADR